MRAGQNPKTIPMTVEQAKAATIEGTNPSLAIVDEYHLHPDNGVYSALELGMGARPEAILFAITTAGSNVVSACKQHCNHFFCHEIFPLCLFL